MTPILKHLHLTNFKCFRDHTITFEQITIMIGQNNAGKTTVVEALRILGLVCSRFKTVTTYSNRPDWLSDRLLLSTRGIRVSAKAIDTDLEQIFTSYGNPPAVIEAFFTEAIAIHVYINSASELFAVFQKNGAYLHNKQKVLASNLPNVRVLPQIVPLTKDEDRVSFETLQRNRFSKRISGNFRNELLAAQGSADYQKLQECIGQTWGSVQINSIAANSDGTKVYLNMRDTDFVTEIYFMGHGIQMWLQTLWFVVSSEPDSIIVLDEPDVYMHADLQRKLVRLLKGSYAQTVIATHSIEIMSEVPPENILIIDRKRPVSNLADSYPVLQAAISSMGSIQNINLSRLLNHRRYLYVEGEDIDILKIFYDKLFPGQSEPLDHFPSVSTGGWGSWDIQKNNARKLLEHMPDLKIYFIYDRDYHRSEDIQYRKEDAARHHINIHIWERKELENYTLVPDAIARFVAKKHPGLSAAALSSEISQMLEEICNNLRSEVIDKISDEAFRGEKGVEPSTIRNKVIRQMETAWNGLDSAVRYVPGKKVISLLSAQCQQRYHTAFNARQLASSLQNSEIDQEVYQLLLTIKEGR